MMRGSFSRAGRGGTRRPQLYTSEALHVGYFIVEAGDGFADERRLHVGLSIFSFQVVLLTSGRLLPPHSPARLSRPGLPNQLIRAAKAAAKRRYFYQKSCLLPHFFAAFKSFSDFYLLSVEKRLQSHRLAQSLALARSFTVEKQLQSSNFLTIFTAL